MKAERFMGGVCHGLVAGKVGFFYAEGPESTEVRKREKRDSSLR